MNTFSTEIISNKGLSMEMVCNECGDKFSAELDLNLKDEQLPIQSEGVLYCLYCEKPYEFTLNINSNNLEVIFKEFEILGGLKISEKIHLQELEGTTPEKSRQFYFLQIERFEKILKLKSGEHIIDQTLYRLIYSGVITALETYLEEIFTYVVFHSGHTLKKFVLEYEPFKKEKFSLQEIFKEYNNLEVRVKDVLGNFVYHNIPKLIKIFNIFNFNLDHFIHIRNIAIYIQKRHNLVHKSGIGAYDSLVEINQEELKTLIIDVNLFVDYIAGKVRNNCFSPYDDLDVPF